MQVRFIDRPPIPVGNHAGSNGLPRCLRCGAQLTTENYAELPPVVLDLGVEAGTDPRPRFVNVLVWSVMAMMAITAGTVLFAL